MAIIGTSPSQQAARAMLLDVIREEAGRNALSSTSELMGYFLSGLGVAESYNPQIPTAPRHRHIAAPEFLSGLLTNTTT